MNKLFDSKITNITKNCIELLIVSTNQTPVGLKESSRVANLVGVE